MLGMKSNIQGTRISKTTKEEHENEDKSYGHWLWSVMMGGIDIYFVENDEFVRQHKWSKCSILYVWGRKRIDEDHCV